MHVGSTASEWRLNHCAPHLEWDQGRLLGSPLAEEHSSTAPRILLVGLSHDLELASLARLLSNAAVDVRILLLDMISDLPRWELFDLEPQEFDVGYCRAYRSDRPIPYHFDKTLRQSEPWGVVDVELRRYVAEQVDTLFWALMDRFRVDRWVNSPHSVRSAENKLIQLDVARRCGFCIPETLVSCRRDEVLRFVAELPHGAISKSLDSPVANPGQESSQFRYTSPVVPELIEEPRFPELIQERVRPQAELRVTVVGQQIFAAKIRSAQRGGPTDWRMSTDHHTRFEATSLTDSTRRQIQELMERLDLQVGGIDLLISEESTYFLEVNPSCAYVWLERSSDAMISRALMNLVAPPRSAR